MAFFDWNGNGEADAFDMAMDYQIFLACTEDEDEGNDVFGLDDDTDTDFFED
jgi:hypothetical protein